MTENSEQEKTEFTGEDELVVRHVPDDVEHFKRGYEVPPPASLVRDVEEEGEGLAVYTLDEAAEDVRIPSGRDTVADLNPEHPGDAPVVGVIFKDHLRRIWGDEWMDKRVDEPAHLIFSSGSKGLPVYTYPVTRLEWGDDVDMYGCFECGMEFLELELSSDARLPGPGGPCPECGEMSLKVKNGGPTDE